MSQAQLFYLNKIFEVEYGWDKKIYWPIHQVNLFISFPVIAFQATSGYSPEGD